MRTSGEVQGGRYIVDYALGRGGFGVTYRAFHAVFDDIVAIKEYLPQKMAHRDGVGKLTLVEGKDEAFEAGKKKFIEEGRTLRRLKHTRGIRAHDLFEEGGTVYLVMEYIEGRTLRQELEDLQNEGRRMALTRLDWLVGELVEALSEIHALNILHLDLKPENIMLTETGHVVLVDFGSSRPEGRLRTATQVQRTEQYAAPEILARRAVGPHSDLYSLGAMICEILTGQCPKQPMARSLDLHKTGKDWEPSDLNPLWHQRLKPALALSPSDRPESLRVWWQETSRLAPSPDESTALARDQRRQRLRSPGGTSCLAANPQRHRPLRTRLIRLALSPQRPVQRG